MKLNEAGETQDLSPEAISHSITNTYERIKQHLVTTRVVFDEAHHLLLKCEHEQTSGSFKLRGALSKLSLLEPNQKIVTASTGNHGLGVVTAAKIFELHPIIFLPATASPRKVEKLKLSGAELNIVEGDSLDAELTGKAFAKENDLPWISPYNDPDIISGQGTLGLELDEQVSNIERVYITVGGGGLISGIASWIKTKNTSVEIIGCQPVNSPEMYLSVLAGKVVDAPDASDTLSDGSAGPLEADSITFPICSALIDRFVLISEEEIKEAIRYLYHTHQMIVEGAAGVAMAAAMKEFNPEEPRKSVVILCGGNIDPVVHRTICRY